MKRTSLLIMTLIVCAASSVYAGTLMITKKDLGGSKVAIGYSASSADCIPAAFALQCTLTGGTVSPSSVLSFSNVFNAFPDYIYSNPMGYYFGVGMPLAKLNTAGALTNSAAAFSICMSAFVPHEASQDSIADINCDGFVGITDVVLVTSNWLSYGAGYADLNRDELIDIRDFALLSEGLSYAPLKEDALIVLQLPQGLNASDLTLSADTLRGGIAFANGVNCPVVFVPEPATMFLLALGGAMLRQRVKVNKQ